MGSLQILGWTQKYFSHVQHGSGNGSVSHDHCSSFNDSKWGISVVRAIIFFFLFATMVRRFEPSFSKLPFSHSVLHQLSYVFSKPLPPCSFLLSPSLYRDCCLWSLPTTCQAAAWLLVKTQALDVRTTMVFSIFRPRFSSFFFFFFFRVVHETHSPGKPTDNAACLGRLGSDRRLWSQSVF